MAYLYHAVSGSVLAQLVVTQTKSFLGHRADACQVPWSLVPVWQASSGSSKPWASSGAWFSELDCNQLDINCQFQEQLSIIIPILPPLWQMELSDQKVQFSILKPWQSYFLNTIWVAAVFRWRDMAFLEYEGSSPGFLSQMPLMGPVFLQFRTTEGGVCVQYLASWLGQWWWSWMVGFSVDFKYQVFKCLQTQYLCWQDFE